MSKSRGKGKMLRIRWVRSAIGCPQGMRQAIRGLGLRRLQQSVEREDTAAIRGMIAKVHHLVEVEGQAEGQAGRAGER